MRFSAIIATVFATSQAIIATPTSKAAKFEASLHGITSLDEIDPAALNAYLAELSEMDAEESVRSDSGSDIDFLDIESNTNIDTRSLERRAAGTMRFAGPGVGWTTYVNPQGLCKSHKFFDRPVINDITVTSHLNEKLLCLFLTSTGTRMVTNHVAYSGTMKMHEWHCIPRSGC